MKTTSIHCRAAIIASTALCAALSTSASAETFSWAGTTDPQTLDPHAVNTAPVLGFLNNVYEGLVRRNKQMQVEPALATSWEQLDEGGWRFNLREGVTFHDGSDFDADDVLFSYERASSESADTRSWFSPISEVRVVDPYTIDFLTTAPNPLFPGSIANFMIMDRDWTVENGAELPSKEAENHATRNANGTGAYTVTARDPGVRTELEPFADWWDTNESNITRAVFTPIGSGKNPFQDVRVRTAAYQSIDVNTLIDKIMRGNAQPAAQLVSDTMNGYSTGLSERLAYDPEAAKALLAEAGYPDGFSFGLQCPNDRYINDESICKAAASMMAKVGLNARLNSMPVRNYWPELREGNFDMYLLGWSPGTFDAEHPIRFLASTPNAEKKLGSWNFGGYSNERVDELLPMIQTELDETGRQAMIDEVHALLQDERAYIPMYVQPLIWASKDNIELTQRSDNFFILRWVSIN